MRYWRTWCGSYVDPRGRRLRIMEGWLRRAVRDVRATRFTWGFKNMHPTDRAIIVVAGVGILVHVARSLSAP